MTDYTQNVDYSDKDVLLTGDPEKLILGSDIDAELAELVTAVASKYDDTDIATEAQAIALASNVTLITPLRLGQALSGGAGILADLVALTDPNADRGLFWDDSAGAVVFFDLGTGLTFTNTTLGLALGSIDHDALLNFSANEHVDHSTVSITTAAGSGLQGGGTIAASRSLALDINGLTTDNTVDYAVDYLPYYDAGEGAPNKVLASVILGVPLGDGRWYRDTPQSIPANTPTTLIYDTQVYNTLERGTYSTTTGIYTAGASGARLLVNATFTVAALGSSRSMTILGVETAGECARASHSSLGGTETTPTVSVAFVVSLAAGQTCFVQGFVTTSANATPASSAGKYNTLSIVELG